MSYAVISSISARTHLKFEEQIDATDGVFYLMAIEQDQVIVASSGSVEEVKKVFGASRKPIIAGTFWEEYLEYRWVDMDDNMFMIDVGGTFAFEGDDGESLERYGLDDGTIETLLLAWAEDGDSPKRIPTPVGVDGELSECKEDREFEGF